MRVMQLAARALLQVDTPAATEADQSSEDAPVEDTLPLRIAAIFIILAAALLCGVPTLFMPHFRSLESVFGRIARAFSGGIILALALIHIIPDAVGELDGLVDYPIGGVAVLFGIVVLMVLDNAMLAAFAPAALACPVHTHAPRTKDVSDPRNNADTTRSHSHQCMSNTHAQHVEASAASAELQQDKHVHGKVGSSGGLLAVLRQKVTAYTMELGCIFHSIIIGVGVGVILDDKQLVVTLIIALSIHQGLEALALGSVLAAISAFSIFKKLSMLVAYAITSPLGIAIGIGVASSYDEESITSRAVQGTINGVSGGMLLYIGIYQLIGEEFSREDMLTRTALRWGMYAAMLLGAALMSVLAIWA